MSSGLRERALCLLNADGTDPMCQPWLTMTDAQFHSEVAALYAPSNINPIQSIQTDYLSPFISYFWSLVYHEKHVWAVDHPMSKETVSIPFVMKYDLLIWNMFYRSPIVSPSIRGDLVCPKVLILAPDWSTCEITLKHLCDVKTDLLTKVQMCSIYEGQNVPDDLYRSYLNQGCDLLITTPTILHDLIERRYIHFEKLEMIVYDQINHLISNGKYLEEFFHHLDLHTHHQRSSIQQIFLSRLVNQQCKAFLAAHLPSYTFLSSSMLETYTYQNYFVYCEPCRNWTERKHLIQQALDLAAHCQKKVVMCANQMRRLTTMQNILNDHSIQSTLIHSQLSSSEIEEYVNEWRTIRDRPFVLLIQDDVLHDIAIDDADLIIHLDVQRLNWYYLCNQRLKLVYKSLTKHHPVQKPYLTSLKSIEQFYQTDDSNNIPLIILPWPGDCAQVTFELIDYLKESQCYIHPLIERLAHNNCQETIQAKIDVEFCPSLKAFGYCLNASKLKRCPYRHQFHKDLDSIEERPTDESKINANLLSDSFDLYLPRQGEVELRVTHVINGNRLYGQVLRSRHDTNEPLKKIFDYDRFEDEVNRAFEQVKHRPLNEIVPGEVYFYCDEKHRVHRVYVHEQERGYFDLRRSDAILNRVMKFAQVESPKESEPMPTESTSIISKTSPNSSMICISSPSTSSNGRPTVSVFSLDTGITFNLTSNESLYPIEPVTLKQYPPLATEIVLCNIRPLDHIQMTFTPFTIDTLRSLTLDEIFMGRIQLATRSCLWIDPLVKPMRLASLNRIVYDKPIRKQLLSNRLVETNEEHLVVLEKLAIEAQLKEETVASAPEPVQETSPTFEPFVNRSGQLIINPLGRSKEFFSKHQPSSDSNPPVPSSAVGRGRVRPETIDLILSTSQDEQTIKSTVTTPSEVGSNKMAESQEKSRADGKKETTEEASTKTVNDDDDDPDQMMFIFGPKLYSQLRQIKDMEDEQRRQADFPVQRNRHRHGRSARTLPKNLSSDVPDENNSPSAEAIPAPNMSRYEPFVGERGAFTQEQIDYKQTQRKTRLFWEQTSRDVYLTIGFYNVDSTQTRVEFRSRSIYCRTKIRQYDRFVRIHLTEEILPEKCSFQVRRSNILLTLRKEKEGQTWTKLTDQPLEPRPEFFLIEYGSDDESESEKRRRTVREQWEQIREEKRKVPRNNDEEKYLLDDPDEDEPDDERAGPTNTDPIENENADELTETSSDCHSTDSDDCYYEDQVPANHIPRGYDEADFDHRFYGSQTRTE